MSNVKPSESIGLGLSPTYRPGRIYKADKLAENKRLSMESQARIAAKYEKPTGKKLVLVVDSNLRLHSTVLTSPEAPGQALDA